MGQKYILKIFDVGYKYYISDGVTVKYLESSGWEINSSGGFILKPIYGGLELRLSESQYNQLLACNSGNIDSFIRKYFPEVEL